MTIVDYPGRLSRWAHPDGRIAIRHKGRDLPYRTFDKLQKVNQAAIVENKRLGEILAYIAARQREQHEGRSKTWGEPDIIAPYPASGGGPLKGKKGIILFEISGWGNAQGHATLWNGSGCYDHCYFNEPGAAYKTNCANFWSLP